MIPCAATIAMSRGPVWLVAVALAFASAATAGRANGQTVGPNLLFMMADQMRFDRCVTSTKRCHIHVNSKCSLINSEDRRPSVQRQWHHACMVSSR